MRVVAFVLTGALLFAGCAEDSPKEPDPTSRPSATASAPSMPPAAQENTKAGAIAFVKHYIDVFNYASNTGDVKELQNLSDANCEGCTEYIKLYKKTYEDGGYYRDSEWKLASIEGELQGDQLIVFGTVDVPAGHFKIGKSSSEQESSAEQSKLTFIPKTRENGWQLKVLALQANSK